MSDTNETKDIITLNSLKAYDTAIKKYISTHSVKGEPGKSLNWRGNWSDINDYLPMDCVRSDVGLYICTNEVKAINNPNTPNLEPANWDCLIEWNTLKGEDGESGSKIFMTTDIALDMVLTQPYHYDFSLSNVLGVSEENTPRVGDYLIARDKTEDKKFFVKIKSIKGSSGVAIVEDNTFVYVTGEEGKQGETGEIALAYRQLFLHDAYNIPYWIDYKQENIKFNAPIYNFNRLPHIGETFTAYISDAPFTRTGCVYLARFDVLSDVSDDGYVMVSTGYSNILVRNIPSLKFRNKSVQAKDEYMYSAELNIWKIYETDSYENLQNWSFTFLDTSERENIIFNNVCFNSDDSAFNRAPIINDTFEMMVYVNGPFGTARHKLTLQVKDLQNIQDNPDISEWFFDWSFNYADVVCDIIDSVCVEQPQALSAYDQYRLTTGNMNINEEEFLESLKGQNGQDGTNGVNGSDGRPALECSFSPKTEKDPSYYLESAGNVLNIGYNTFNRTPVVGDYFMTGYEKTGYPDNDSFVVTWRVVTVAGMAECSIVSYVNNRGTNGTQLFTAYEKDMSNVDVDNPVLYSSSEPYSYSILLSNIIQSSIRKPSEGDYLMASDTVGGRKFLLRITRIDTLSNVVTATVENPQALTYITGEKGQDGKDGKDGAAGAKGADGVTPTVEISADGYWIINGKNTGVKAGSVDLGQTVQFTYNNNTLYIEVPDDFDDAGSTLPTNANFSVKNDSLYIDLNV